MKTLADKEKNPIGTETFVWICSMTKEAKFKESLTDSYSLQTPDKIEYLPFESNWSYGIVVNNNPLNALDPLGLECTQSPWRRATTYSDPNNKGTLISSYTIKRWHKIREWNTLPLPGNGRVMQFSCACSWEKSGYKTVSTYVKNVLFEADITCCGKQAGKIYTEVSEFFTETKDQPSIFSPEITVTLGVYDGNRECTCRDPNGG